MGNASSTAVAKFYLIFHIGILLGWSRAGQENTVLLCIHNINVHNLYPARAMFIYP